MSDVDRYQYGYDQNSNRLYKANVVGTPVVSGGLDEYYTYDNLNRLTVMQRGTLNSGRTGISGTPSREMNYTLDPTGNWSSYLTKTAGTTDLNQTRTANTVNETTAIGGTPGWATPPAYDAVGNMTSFPQPASLARAFTATYDAWNRMVSINNSSGTVATYQYDGLGRRIVKITASIPETRHFCYTSSWQDIEERTGTSTTMDKQYVWGARYIDELVCRDDATQRLYAMQDANFNLTSISITSGGVVERYLFDPYGSREIMNGSWGVISASAYSWVIGHQGLMQDQESGLIYNRARYLSAALGRFLQRDPAGYIDGADFYQYVKSNPIALTDDTGTWSAPPAGHDSTIVKLSNGSSTCTGLVVIAYETNPSNTSIDAKIPYGHVNLNFVSDPDNCPCCKNPQWKTMVRVYVDQLSHDVQDYNWIYKDEGSEHTPNPLDGWAPDPNPDGMTGNPRDDYVNLIYRGVRRHIGVYKQFESKLFCDGRDTGFTVSWAFSGTTYVRNSASLSGYSSAGAGP